MHITTIYQDARIWVCVKPPGILSTDEPGGMPELLRRELGDERACIRSVHRLDAAVGGIMVYARSRRAASLLSEQLRGHSLQKTYLAVVHGCPQEPVGQLNDLLGYDTGTRMAYIASEPGKDVRPASLGYEVLAAENGLSLLRVHLYTGRTHQIRIQFASRGLSLWGDGKYGTAEAEGSIALWSHRLAFAHPQSGESLTFSALPPNTQPWMSFHACLEELK